jgi:hypothetical protein
MLTLFFVVGPIQVPYGTVQGGEVGLETQIGSKSDMSNED